MIFFQSKQAFTNDWTKGWRSWEIKIFPCFYSVIGFIHSFQFKNPWDRHLLNTLLWSKFKKVCKAFDSDAFHFRAFYFIQFDGSVNVSKADHNPAFDKYIGYLLLCCLLRFFKSEILSSIIPLTSICTCNEWNRFSNFFLLLLCHYYVNNILLAFSRF